MSGNRCFTVTLFLCLSACFLLLLSACEDGPLEGKHTYLCKCNCGINDPYIPSYTVIYDTIACADSESDAKTDCVSMCDKTCPSCYCGLGATPSLLDENFCRHTGKKTSALMAYKSPYATFEGLVDPERSWITITNLDDNDSATVKVKGEIVITGGDCLKSNCPFKITYTSFAPVKSFWLSGKHATELKALNHGIWSGDKYFNDTFSIDLPSYLSLGWKLDGKYMSAVVQAKKNIKGLFHISWRGKGTQYVKTNALVIEGSFVENDVHVGMHLHIWLANCQPQVIAHASCVTDPDGVTPYVQLNGYSGQMLANMDQKDLCNAVKDQSYTTECSGSDPEFTCFKGPEKVTGQLTYAWTDADGKLISNQALINLKDCPKFPVTLTVMNEWGRIATQTIWQGPAGKCAQICAAPPSIPKPGAFDPSKCNLHWYRITHEASCKKWEDMVKTVGLPGSGDTDKGLFNIPWLAQAGAVATLVVAIVVGLIFLRFRRRIVK